MLILLMKVIVNKRIAKANKRNRLKRLIRESYRLQKENLKKGYNIVFIWNKQANVLNNNYKNVSQDIIELFNRAGMYR